MGEGHSIVNLFFELLALVIPVLASHESRIIIGFIVAFLLSLGSLSLQLLVLAPPEGFLVPPAIRPKSLNDIKIKNKFK